MRGKGRGWTLVGVLLAVMAALPALVQGQVATTTVQDTVYSADGTPAAGTVVVSWAAFTTAGGSVVPAGTTSTTIGTGGALSIDLVPDAGATPLGSYYTAVFHLSDGTTSRQFWVIPAVLSGGAPVKLAAIEQTVLPTSVAMQTVSKSYVDNAIAKAVTGVAPDSSATPYVLKTGDTMSGPLLLPGDPVSAQQAADKNYVDESVAQLSGGGSTKVSTVPTASQTVAQPASTQLEVNRLNGALDATGFVSGTGNNGIANALTSPECAGGCEVRASQSYPGTEAVSPSAIPSGGHVRDGRGGAITETFVNPLGLGNGSNIASTVAQVTTRTAQQAVAARPGIAGPNSYVLDLMQTAPTGGSNQFPATHETVPYGKSNYGVLQLTGTYNTQGQHVQLGNTVYCYSVGDCLAGGQFITSSGGYRDEADEGTHPYDLQVAEDSRVFQGTCGSGCATGATSLVISQTANPGTQGDGRFLMDKNAAKVISTGSLVSAGGDLFQTALFSGTSFPVSVFLVTAQAAASQAGNLQPGTVTLPIATSGLASGFSTSTAALPATTGVACVADPTSTGVFPNFETANYTTVDATHLKLTLNKVHSSGAVIAVSGLCGYGLEQTVDTTGQVRQVFPVVGSLSGTELYYAGALTGVVGYSSAVNTSGYLNTSTAITSVVRNGNVVTLTAAGSFPYDLNGLSLTVSGVADTSYNGTFAVTTTGGNTLSYVNTGANSSSTGGNVGILTGGFNLYPMAEVLSVANPATAQVDGTMTLAPNTVAWAAGDAVEEPHYHQQLVSPDTEVVTQYVPRPIQYSSSGKSYNGQNGPGLRGWQVTNSTAASNYLGAGGTHQPPDDAYVSAGVWNNTFEVDAGEQAVLRVHCNLRTCSRWDSAYSLFALDSHIGQDFVTYDPNSDTAVWNMAGIASSFSPAGFYSPTVNAPTLYSTKISGGGSGTLDGLVIGSTAPSQGTFSSSVSATGATLTASNTVSGTAIPFAAYCPNGTAGQPCLIPVGRSFSANNVGFLAWQPAGFFQMQTYNNGSPIQIGGSVINTTASLMVNNGAVVNQLGNTCSAGISLCVNSGSTMTVDTNGNVTAQTYHETLSTPASSSAACNAGDFSDDANFHYVCVSTNTWKRVALSAF